MFAFRGWIRTRSEGQVSARGHVPVRGGGQGRAVLMG